MYNPEVITAISVVPEVDATETFGVTPEVDAAESFLDSAGSESEIIESPIKLSEMHHRPSATSRVATGGYGGQP